MESLWKKTEKSLIENGEKLNGNTDTDVCIVGGGITGISTAYNLVKEGKKVVILERDKLANSTTGNTTGKITSQHGLFYKYLITDFGKEYAKTYYDANQEAIENIANIIKEENIKCDFERQDAFVYTRSEEEIQKIKDEVEALREIEGKAEYVSKIDAPINNVLRWNKISKSSDV